MDCHEPHLAPNEKTQPIQWTKRPTGALVAVNSLWPIRQTCRIFTVLLVLSIIVTVLSGHKIPFRKGFTNGFTNPSHYIPPFYLDPLFFWGWRGFWILFLFFCFCFFCVCVYVCIGDSPTMGALLDLRSSRPLGRRRLKICKAPLAHDLLLCETIVFFFFVF